MRSLLLDTSTWDLVLDVSGNIAIASNPYAIAQDAACCIKLFAGELWYDTTQGVPYFGKILGQAPSLQFVKEQLAAAALKVPESVSAVAYVSAYDQRTRLLSGQVQIIDVDGTASATTFVQQNPGST